MFIKKRLWVLKLVCDCGNEVEFKETESTDEDVSVFTTYAHKDFTICVEHDEAWVTCSKYNKSIHFFA